MNVLVTGGAGFIGSHVVEGLIAAGARVDVLDDLSTGDRARLSKKARFTRGDVRDGRRLRDLLRRRRADAVVHLAAQVNVRVSLADPSHDASLNVMGGLSVLRACAESGVGRLVFASSGGAIYGDQDRYPCREDAPARPNSPYGVAKLSFEHYARSFESSGLRAVHLRLANVYGPRQDPAGEAGVIAIFSELMLKGRSPRVFGDGRQTRDYVFVTDVARAFRAGLRARPGVYNVGTGRETSVNTLVREIAERTGFQGRPTHESPIGGEVRRNVLDIRRARRVLGWAPRVRLDEGLDRTVSWFKDLA
ncbi:MAG TPA: NAD-dependent epimerase/dehydratase family protein [Planctomycetota bacterium]